MAEAVHQRILRRIDKLIDPAGLEAGRQEDVPVGRHHGVLHRLRLAADAGLDAGEAPLVVRDHLRRVVGIAPPRQHRVARVERDGGIGMRGDPAAEREAGDARRVGDVFDADAPGDRPAVVARHRHVEHHAAVAGQHVALPGEPRHRIAAAHEEAVAGVRQRDRRVAVRRVVVELQRALVAAVAVVIEHAPVAALHLARLEDHEVGGEAHQPAVVDRRLVEIHDVPLRRGARIDGEMRAARQPLIGADVAEGVAAGERNALGDPQFDPLVMPAPGSAAGTVRLGGESDKCCRQRSASIQDQARTASGTRAIWPSGNSGCGARDMRRVNTTTTCSRSIRTPLSAFRGIGMPARLQYEIRIAPSASARSMNTRVEVSSP